MKTIFKDEVYDRVDDATGDFKVKSQGWKFVPKSEWKKNVRDVEKAARAEAEKAKAEAKAKAKAAKAEKTSKKDSK
jgi:hypothetical protein